MGTIVQKCPKCGQWCEAEEASLLDRGAAGMLAINDIGEKVGGFVGKIFGETGEKFGKKVGGLVASAGGGLAGGFGGMVLGDSYYFQCPTCNYEWSASDENEDQSQIYFAEREKIEEGKKRIIHSLIDKWNECETREDYLSLISTINDYLQTEDFNETDKSILYDSLAATSYMVDRNEAAINYINKSITLFPDDSNSITYRGLYKSALSSESRDSLIIYDILKDLSYFYKERHGIQYFDDSTIKNTLEKCIKEYAANFHEIHPAQRQFVYFKDNFDSITDKVKILPLRRSVSNINFPVSHPKLNTLYVLHPLKDDTYLPVDNYDFELFNDQLLEFARIMEHLGAKRISYQILENKSNEEFSSKDKNYSLEAKIKVAGGSGKVDLAEENSKMNKLLHKFELEASYFDRGEIKMPSEDSLVWYHYNKDWKQKVESRLAGRKKKESFIVSSYKEDFGSEGDKKEIEAEVSYLMNSVSGKMNIEKKFCFKNSIQQQWKVEVEFYPLKESFLRRMFKWFPFFK